MTNSQSDFLVVNQFLLNTQGIGISLVSGSPLHVSLNTHSKMCDDMI